MTTETKEQENPFAGFITEEYKDGQLVDPAKAAATGGDDTELAPDGLRVDDVPDEDENNPRPDDDEPDTDPVSEPEEGEEEVSPDETPDQKIDRLAREKAKKMASGRIGQLTAKNRDLERRLAALEQTAQAGATTATKQDLDKQAVEFMKKDPKAPQAPDPSKFELGEFDKDYTEAYMDYRDARKEYLTKVKDQLRAEQGPGKASADVPPEFVAKLERFQDDDKGVKGFKEALAAAERQEYPVSLTAAQYIVDSPMGREIAVHLHRNPNLAKEIARLPDIQQAARLGKLEAVLEARRKAAPVVSKAPAPLTAIKGGGGSKTPAVDSENFEDAERAILASVSKR